MSEPSSDPPNPPPNPPANPEKSDDQSSASSDAGADENVNSETGANGVDGVNGDSGSGDDVQMEEVKPKEDTLEDIPDGILNVSAAVVVHHDDPKLQHPCPSFLHGESLASSIRDDHMDVQRRQNSAFISDSRIKDANDVAAGRTAGNQITNPIDRL